MIAVSDRKADKTTKRLIYIGGGFAGIIIFVVTILGGLTWYHWITAATVIALNAVWWYVYFKEID